MLCRWRELRDILKRNSAIFLLVICSAVISILLFPIMGSFFSITDRDESAFIYVAKGILEGEVPYLDRWDHKGPAIYALNLAGLAISGSWGIWIVQTLFLLSSSWFLFLAMKQNFGIFPSLFAVSIFLIYLERFEPGNFTEYYSLLFQFVTLYLFARVERRNRRESWLPLAIGVLGGCAFLLRPNLVGIWLAVGLYWVPGARGPEPAFLVHCRRSGDNRCRCRCLCRRWRVERVLGRRRHLQSRLHRFVARGQDRCRAPNQGRIVACFSAACRQLGYRLRLSASGKDEGRALSRSPVDEPDPAPARNRARLRIGFRLRALLHGRPPGRHRVHGLFGATRHSFRWTRRKRTSRRSHISDYRAIVKSGVRGVVHAAALLCSMVSMPSLNWTPSMTFARCRKPRSRRQDFSAHRPIL